MLPITSLSSLFSLILVLYSIFIHLKGLGRLAWEIFSKGYSVQGSDFSLPMLLASDFMLNGCHGTKEEDEKSNGFVKQFGISPWICETKNAMTHGQRVRTVIVPDVDPNAASSNDDNNHHGQKSPPEFTMLAGEFLSLYSHFLPNNNHHPKCHSPAKKFHGIACSFFLDTAPSLPHYLLTIYHMLEEGGLLINFGPLMYRK